MNILKIVLMALALLCFSNETETRKKQKEIRAQNMATKTSTETKREITKRGDVIIIKEVEKITTYVAGKEPIVKEITKVEEFKGEEGFKRLPEDIRRQLEQPNQEKAVKPANKPEIISLGNFVNECLNEHNKYRKIHGMEPLKLSEELIRVSEARALELAAKDMLSSRPDNIYGENLSCMWSSDPEHSVKAPEIVARWYSEEKNYKYGEEPTNLNAGYFTQIVWQNTKEFGVAVAKSNSNKIYIVATYSPPGNYIGQFTKNVYPPGTKISAKKSVEINLDKLSLMPNSIKNSQSNSTGAETNTSIAQLNKECLACHNQYRMKHGVPPLVYSETLAKYSQEWANELAKLDRMEHRRNGKYGENLYSFKSLNPQAQATAADACNSWYSEIQAYDFNSEPKTLGTGHFTQMIWKNTKEVGMGRAKSKSGLQIIVANYNPPGNFVGMFRANVPKPA